MSWFEKRFQESAKKVRVECQSCNRQMWLPPSKAAKYLTCSPECAAARRAESLKARERLCSQCGQSFIARPVSLRNGGGKFCSLACTEHLLALGRTHEAAMKRGEERRAKFKTGEFVPLRGEKNGRWKGGLQAHIARATADGRRAKWTRRYRQNNPEKAREMAQNRRNRMAGRLPRGTVKRIGEAQRWKCAVCKVRIQHRFHVDHIEPLAKGGSHEPRNIQLLCPGCNVRKSAKDPLQFMRERGYLL